MTEQEPQGQGDQVSPCSPLTILMAGDRVCVTRDDAEPGNPVWKVVVLLPGATVAEFGDGLRTLPENVAFVGTQNAPGEQVMVFVGDRGAAPPDVARGDTTLFFSMPPSGPPPPG